MDPTPAPAAATSITHRYELISREDALARGLKRFYTGKLCDRNHRSQRYVSNGACIQCVTFKPAATVTRNQCWPTQALLSNVQPFPEPEEVEAAFRMIEAYGWLDHCILEIRKNPALLAQFRIPLPTTQQGPLVAQADAAYARALREYERLQALIQQEQAVTAANIERLRADAGNVTYPTGTVPVGDAETSKL